MPEGLKRKKRPKLSKRRLAALIADATVDCYNESEAIGGFFTMIEDHLEIPFASVALGVDVEVTGVKLTEREEIVAVFPIAAEWTRIRKLAVCTIGIAVPRSRGLSIRSSFALDASGPHTR